MPATELWAVSIKGNVYTLSTAEQQWKQLPNQSRCLCGFKKVAALPFGALGLGCDHQVYVYVRQSDVPIRFQESTFENERWIPALGWSHKNLLPVDPWGWSNKEGTIHLPKEDIKLPSENWAWESDWYVDENVKGHLTDKGGWRYSTVDFKAEFSHVKTFRSCVRRRKWIRYRRYVATGKWARLPSIHVDPLEEPIMDLSVGGHLIPHQAPGFAQVWILTIDGRLLYRHGISHICPEGQNWHNVNSEEGKELLSVSAGPLGMVWAITWDGNIVTRMGVNWQNPKGTSWSVVDSPDPSEKLVDVSVGVAVAWVVSSTGKNVFWFSFKVWFRKGIRNSVESPTTQPTRTGWLQMVQKMRCVSVGANDQLWGIDWDDRQLYFRYGITDDEQTGKTWKIISLPYEKYRESLSSALSMPSNYSLHSIDDTAFDQPMDRYKSKDEKFCDMSVESNRERVSCDSGDHMTFESVSLKHGEQRPNQYDVGSDHAVHCVDSTATSIDHLPLTKPTIVQSDDTEDYLDPEDGLLDAELKIDLGPDSDRPDRGNTKKQAPSPIEKTDKSKLHKLTTRGLTHIAKGLQKFNRETHSIKVSFKPGSQTGLLTRQSLSATSEVTSDSHSEDRSSMSEDSFDDNMTNDYGAEPEDGEIQWLSLSGKQCIVHDESSVKQWFRPDMGSNERALYQRQLSQNTWRNHILNLLKQRNSILVPFLQYDLAVEKSVWVKKGKLKWWQDVHRGHYWVDCQLELTQDKEMRDNISTLSMLYQHKGQHLHMQINLADIVGVQILNERDQPACFCIHTIERQTATPRRQPAFKLATQTEEDLEDWVSALNIACCDVRGLNGSPAGTSAWALSDRGDIFVQEAEGYHTDHLLWHQIGGHLRKIEGNPDHVTWGIGYDGTGWVYTGGYGGGFFKGMSTSPHGIRPQTDVREFYLYENQRWRPVRGYTNKLFQVWHYLWSDETGKVECTKEGTRLLSKHWQWVSDWTVDRNVVGGADKDGWQYGRNFTNSFYARPRMRCYLRRRRWIRQCKLVTTGPWEEVPPLPLQDVSVQFDTEIDVESSVAVWAVGANGDVLCRVGVNKANSKGTAWYHVSTDQPFTSISIGGGLKIWATAKDGSVWLRRGVSNKCVIGSYWFHIAPPEGVTLMQVSAGATSVWVVDHKQQLWVRSGISMSLPEGLEWHLAAKNVRQVSAGANDQVWTIVDSIPSTAGSVSGVVCRRVAMTDNDAKAGSWDSGVGGGWLYVTCRGLKT